MKLKNIRFGLLFTLLLLLFGGWGKNGHRIISYNTAEHFPKEISFLGDWRDYLSLHASDPDSRKGSDASEGQKHYIDIENYQEFVTLGKLNYNYDSTVKVHGAAFVEDQGILPWATIVTFDSLKNCFKRKNWSRAMFFASDLGHYTADGYMPLHVTNNYNGQMTNQTGVHSRYESQMIDAMLSEFTTSADTAIYIKNVNSFVFNYIYKNNAYVDSVLTWDKKASSEAGSTKGTAYIQKLRTYSGSLTIRLFDQASFSLASLIYTSWCDAGRPVFPVSAVKTEKEPIAGFQLAQNYPNPFNPNTLISYTIPVECDVILKLFDVSGREVSVLVNESMQAGTYSRTVGVHKPEIVSGIYFYQLICKYSQGTYSSVKKMIILK